MLSKVCVFCLQVIPVLLLGIGKSDAWDTNSRRLYLPDFVLEIQTNISWNCYERGFATVVHDVTQDFFRQYLNKSSCLYAIPSLFALGNASCVPQTDFHTSIVYIAGGTMDLLRQVPTSSSRVTSCLEVGMSGLLGYLQITRGFTFVTQVTFHLVTQAPTISPAPTASPNTNKSKTFPTQRPTPKLDSSNNLNTNQFSSNKTDNSISMNNLIVILGSLFVFMLLLLIVLLYRRYRKYKHNKQSQDENDGTRDASFLQEIVDEVSSYCSSRVLPMPLAITAGIKNIKTNPSPSSKNMVNPSAPPPTKAGDFKTTNKNNNNNHVPVTLLERMLARARVKQSNNDAVSKNTADAEDSYDDSVNQKNKNNNENQHSDLPSTDNEDYVSQGDAAEEPFVPPYHPIQLPPNQELDQSETINQSNQSLGLVAENTLSFPSQQHVQPPPSPNTNKFQDWNRAIMDSTVESWAQEQQSVSIVRMARVPTMPIPQRQVLLANATTMDANKESLGGIKRILLPAADNLFQRTTRQLSIGQLKQPSFAASWVAPTSSAVSALQPYQRQLSVGQFRQPQSLAISSLQALQRQPAPRPTSDSGSSVGEEFIPDYSWDPDDCNSQSCGSNSECNNDGSIDSKGPFRSLARWKEIATNINFAPKNGAHASSSRQHKEDGFVDHDKNPGFSDVDLV